MGLIEYKQLSYDGLVNKWVIKKSPAIADYNDWCFYNCHSFSTLVEYGEQFRKRSSYSWPMLRVMEPELAAKI